MFTVVKAPDSRLRVKTKNVKKVSPALLVTLKEMITTTLSFQDPEGVGLAATQIGHTERYFVGMIGKGKNKDKKPLKAFINPQITWLSKRTKKYFEGCLSIPDTWGETIRSLSIKVAYLDEKGVAHNETMNGVNAWIFQHEVDHLDGKLFVDRVLEQKGKFYKFKGKDNTGGDIFEEVTL